MCGRLRCLASVTIYAALTVTSIALSVSSEALQSPRLRIRPAESSRVLHGMSSVSFLQDEAFETAQSSTRFETGAHVRVNGLQSSTNLNGKDGVVKTFDVLSGRYVIQMTDGGPSKKIRPEHLILLEVSENSSVSADVASHFSPGAHVMLFGLHQMKELNGMTAIIRHFDPSTKRYVVEIHGHPPRKIRPENLQLVESQVERSGLPLRSVCDSASDDGPSRLERGSKVVLYGLRSAAASSLNGLVATVHCFDRASERYVVALPDGTPRKFKPSNLHIEGEEDAAPQEDTVKPSGSSELSEKPASICKQQAAHGFMGPGGFAIGSKVQLYGLKSLAAQSGHWNGMQGVVHCFDAASQRYVVACPDGQPRKIKPANLIAMTESLARNLKSGAKSICQQQAAKGFVGPGGLAIGSKVTIHGLTSPVAIKAGLNGMVGVIHCFDMSTKRFVVSCPDGMPRKLKLQNLQRAAAEEADALALPHSQSKPTSICQPQTPQGDVGPGGLSAGVKVALFGLTSKAAIKGNWNGMVGVVHCYDATSQRYVVAMADGTPRRLKVENLAIVTNAVSQSIPKANNTLQLSHPIHWIKGAYVRLLGLKVATELNGEVGNVVDFENSTQRYVIKVPGSTKLKRVKAANLADVAVSEPSVAAPAIAAVAHLEGAQQPRTGRQLSVCNAYATRSAIQVFAVSGDGKHYSHIVKNLDFQACSDVENVPVDKVAALAFVIGKFQVARKNVDIAGLTPGQGLELVVHRNDPNSLKAVIHENPVELGDNEAYYLHLVNAYAGRKPLSLEVQRGRFVQKMPLDKTYRLSSEQPIKMVLSDGVQKLKLTFQPRRGGTFCIMTTGVDPGLKGEPRNVGLVAHQIGAWTSSEEMDNEDASASREISPRPEIQAVVDQDSEGLSKASSGQTRSSFTLASIPILGKWFGHP
mmetsp:Transcript_116665/g.182347  ORF Transcript_116665/g.182347 Transcript_116665/m.182347 type:complete len:924 (-) Transcript_116665:61-2832(-)